MMAVSSIAVRFLKSAGIKFSRQIVFALFSDRVNTITEILHELSIFQFPEPRVGVLTGKVDSFILRNSSWRFGSLRLQELKETVVRWTHPIRRETKRHANRLGYESVISFVKSEKSTIKTGKSDFMSFTSDSESDLYDSTVTVGTGTTRGPIRSADTRRSVGFQVGRKREPVDPAPARSGSSNTGAETVYDKDARGFNCSDRPAESIDDHATCPFCETLIRALVTRGPGEHYLDPCGCRISEVTARALGGGADRGRGVATDGGHVRTSDAALAAHDHASPLEAALDYLLEASRRAEDHAVDDATVARLKLAVCGARLAFYAASSDERAVGLHDATAHLETAVEAIDAETVGHPARHALQLLDGYAGGGAEC